MIYVGSGGGVQALLLTWQALHRLHCLSGFRRDFLSGFHVELGKSAKAGSQAHPEVNMNFFSQARVECYHQTPRPDGNTKDHLWGLEGHALAWERELVTSRVFNLHKLLL